MQPKSIRSIGKIVNQDRYRIRNIYTLNDYLVQEQEERGFIWVVNLDDLRHYNMNTEIERFVLLSSPEEIEFLNNSTITILNATKIVGKNYAISRAKLLT